MCASMNWILGIYSDDRTAAQNPVNHIVLHLLLLSLAHIIFQSHFIIESKFMMELFIFRTQRRKNAVPRRMKIWLFLS